MYIFYILDDKKTVTKLLNNIKKHETTFKNALDTLYKFYAADKISVPLISNAHQASPVFSYRERLSDEEVSRFNFIGVIPFILNRVDNSAEYYDYTLNKNYDFHSLPKKVQQAFLDLQKCESKESLIFKVTAFSRLYCIGRNSANLQDLFPSVKINKQGNIILIFRVDTQIIKAFSSLVDKHFKILNYKDLNKYMEDKAMEKYGVLNLYVCPNCNVGVEEDEVLRLKKCPHCGTAMQISTEQPKALKEKDKE